jgi:hypothetical protein
MQVLSSIRLEGILEHFASIFFLIFPVFLPEMVKNIGMSGSLLQTRKGDSQ